MSRKNVTKVFNAWLRGEECKGPKGTVWTDGDVIYSYAMPIAVRMSPRSVMISHDSPSVTTSIHRNGVRELALKSDYAVAMMSDTVVKNASRIPKGERFSIGNDVL